MWTISIGLFLSHKQSTIDNLEWVSKATGWGGGGGCVRERGWIVASFG